MSVSHLLGDPIHSTGEAHHNDLGSTQPVIHPDLRGQKMSMAIGKLIEDRVDLIESLVVRTCRTAHGNPILP